jgi:hypothetical protein
MASISNPRARTFAAVIAAVAAFGLIVQFYEELLRQGSYGATLWFLLRFFTIIANIIVMVEFGLIAFSTQPLRKAWMLAGTVLAIMLAGIINFLLLRGLRFALTDADRLADFLLHIATPILAPIFWLEFAKKGALRYHHALVWALLPIAYLIYALVRGGVEGVYPYPFIDVGKIGWAQTLINSATIGVVFLLAGCALVWLDHFLASRRQNRSSAS